MSRSRIAVCTWSVARDGLENVIARVRGTPLRHVQLALSGLVDGDASAALRRLEDAGLTIVSGMMAFAGEDYSTLESIRRTGGVRDDARWPEHRAHAEAVAALAASAGIDLVTFHAGFLPESPGDRARDVMLGRLRDVADLFAARGLRLAFETGQESAATLEGVLDALDRGNVGVNFDPANMILYGMGDPVAALRRLAPRVVQIHVKDAVPSPVPGAWGREMPVGAGAVDWEAFFAAARTVPRAVDYVIEREAGGDRIADIMAARALIARHIDPS